MAEPSDNTKKTASSMFSRVGKSALGGAKKVASSVGKLFTKKPENVIKKELSKVLLCGTYCHYGKKQYILLKILTTMCNYAGVYTLKVRYGA